MCYGLINKHRSKLLFCRGEKNKIIIFKKSLSVLRIILNIHGIIIMDKYEIINIYIRVRCG